MGTSTARQGARGLLSARLFVPSPAIMLHWPGREVADACLGVKGSRVQVPPSRPVNPQVRALYSVVMQGPFLLSGPGLLTKSHTALLILLSAASAVAMSLGRACL
jgi:hypothetical protein